MTRSVIGSRGKTAEKQVQEYLKKLSEGWAEFDYARIYDARSAGGRFPGRPGDFEIYTPTGHGLIEVKEVAHDFRLPAKNFSYKKFGHLHKRQLAGGEIIILVKHTTTGMWRKPPLSLFLEDPQAASWDLSMILAKPTLPEVLSFVPLNWQKWLGRV